MKNLNFIAVFVLMTITFINCRKPIAENKSNTYTITGKILESTGNPVPISNLSLNAYQKTVLGFLGSQKGFSLNTKTESDGTFKISYIAEKGIGTFSLSYNNEPINISSDSVIPNTNTYFYLNYIPALKDTNIGNQYVYKNIETFVRKIKLNTMLAANDTLFLTAGSPIVRTVLGPKPVGTIIIVDVITQFKTSNYDFINNKYFTNAFIRKSSLNFIKDYKLELPIGDEIYREWIMDWN